VSVRTPLALRQTHPRRRVVVDRSVPSVVAKAHNASESVTELAAVAPSPPDTLELRAPPRGSAQAGPHGPAAAQTGHAG
jgi:hypothetical protein